MSTRRPSKNQLFDLFASIGKALGSGRRAEIVDVLAQGERTVEALAAEIDQSVANTSAHLKVLAGAELVASRRQGTHIYYRLTSEKVAALFAAIRDHAVDHVPEFQRVADAYLGDRSGLDVIDRGELMRRLKKGTALVIDIRPAAEFAAGHIPGAVSVPPSELRKRLKKLPRDAEVVAYCRGPFCVYADDAVHALKRRGQAALRLVDGFPEWRAAGLPVEEAQP